MKAKQIIPLVILTLMALGIISASIIFFNTREKKNLKKDSEDIEVSENINSENVEELDEEKEIKQDKVEEQKDNNETTDDSSETESANEVIKESNDVTTNTSKNDTSVSTNNNNQNNNINNSSNNYSETSSNNSQVVEQPKQSTPWDSLGITEYEFYNTPAHSWAELDFKLSDYGSREATLNACKEYGNAYISENGGGYFCDSVNSYSGDYLGEDIDFY